MSRPVHFEILANEPEKMAAFYQQALGWKITTWKGPAPYWLVNTGEEGSPGINGGIMAREFQQGVINTISVASLSETLAKIEAAGGKKVQEPYEIPEVGKHMYCADPEGNLFGLLQPVAE